MASTDDVILPQSNRNNMFRFEKEEQRNGRALEQSDEASDMEFATTRERTIRSLRRRAKKKDRKKALNLGFVESYRAECVYPGLLPKDTRLCPGDPSSPAAPQDDSKILPSAG